MEKDNFNDDFSFTKTLYVKYLGITWLIFFEKFVIRGAKNIRIAKIEKFRTGMLLNIFLTK